MTDVKRRGWEAGFVEPPRCPHCTQPLPGSRGFVNLYHPAPNGTTTFSLSIAEAEWLYHSLAGALQNAGSAAGFAPGYAPGQPAGEDS